MCACVCARKTILNLALCVTATGTNLGKLEWQQRRQQRLRALRLREALEPLPERDGAPERVEATRRARRWPNVGRHARGRRNVR